jgi:hypothetical protein
LLIDPEAIEERCMNGPAPYIHWGFILISLPNLVLIAVMVLLFIAALVAPFPGHRGTTEHTDDR